MKENVICVAYNAVDPVRQHMKKLSDRKKVGTQDFEELAYSVTAIVAKWSLILGSASILMQKTWHPCPHWLKAICTRFPGLS